MTRPLEYGGSDDTSDDDSSSEMDISSPSSPGPDVASINRPKRKLSDDEDSTDLASPLAEDAPKKQKLTVTDIPTANYALPAISALPTANAHPPANVQSPAERLPIGAWQLVFLKLSPVMLSRCLRVSKAFNACLTDTSAVLVSPAMYSVDTMNSDTIWTKAKNTYFSTMPKVAETMPVFRMFQLIGGTVCQFCSTSGGPGSAGVRLIWPFSIRTCGDCWAQRIYTVSHPDCGTRRPLTDSTSSGSSF